MSFCLQQNLKWTSLVFRESPIYEIFKLAPTLKNLTPLCFLTFVIVDVMALCDTFIIHLNINLLALS